VGTQTAAGACKEIEARLREFDNPARAEGTKAYLKSDLSFFGATVWEIRSVLREFSAKHPDPTHDQLVDVAARLWAKPNHELRMAAVMLLDSRTDLLGPRDLGFIEQHIRDSRTWAYADAMLDEKEFFIRKAIGWVLRDVSKRRPDEVYRWLSPRAKRASAVTIREAVKYLSAEQREKILDAR
jgi:3-methyladenine DNA glycosylase AlkD